MPVVTLYGKPGCHLCEAVLQTIERVRHRRAFEIRLRNILDDPADFERYQHEIPVVLLDGQEISRHRMTESTMQAALDGAPIPTLRAAIVVMAKFPTPVRVKTRLMPTLSAEEAAAAHRVFL